MIMEAEKSYHLQAGDPGKLVQGQEKMRCPTSCNQGKRGEFPLPLPFVLFGPSTDWILSTHTGNNNLLYRAHSSNANLIQTTQKQCLLWALHGQLR